MFCCICFQILPVIDGFKHVALIAAESNKDVQLVKALIQNLLYVVYVSTFYERSLANTVILEGEFHWVVLSICMRTQLILL